MGRVKQEPPGREGFLHWTTVPVRWIDIDIFGHVNNANYYAYFDTIVNGYTVEAAGYDPLTEEAVALVVESACRYHAPVGFPADLAGGLRVDHLGRTSVRYAIGLFKAGEATAFADGHFVHVYVDRIRRVPAPIPDRIRQAVARLMAAP